jgi:hypothetical protein
LAFSAVKKEKSELHAGKALGISPTACKIKESGDWVKMPSFVSAPSQGSN